MASVPENKMRVKKAHDWNVTPQEARAIQMALRDKWEGEDRLPRIRTVAGMDAAFVVRGPQALRLRSGQAVKQQGRWGAPREANQAIGGVVVYRFPEMQEIARAYALEPLEFPYVPGLLSFREVPALLAALKKLKQMPDVIFCDAQGYAHPRRFGLACHLGVLLDRPTIGCAKSVLVGTHGTLGRKAGSWAPLVDERAGGETIGAALRTRDGVRPVYVSQGHRVGLETAIRLTLQVSDGYRIPRPTRDADHFVGEVKREHLRKRRAAEN